MERFRKYTLAFDLAILVSLVGAFRPGDFLEAGCGDECGFELTFLSPIADMYCLCRISYHCSVLKTAWLLQRCCREGPWVQTADILGLEKAVLFNNDLEALGRLPGPQQ